MDPARKRTVRLLVVLGVAVLLASALIYTSFASATKAVMPSELPPGAPASESFQLTGKVAEGTWRRDGSVNLFRVRDRDGRESVAIRYQGAVPDPFREGREIIITVRRRGDTWIGERDSLITKCPSKFEEEKP